MTKQIWSVNASLLTEVIIKLSKVVNPTYFVSIFEISLISWLFWAEAQYLSIAIVPNISLYYIITAYIYCVIFKIGESITIVLVRILKLVLSIIEISPLSFPVIIIDSGTNIAFTAQSCLNTDGSGNFYYWDC